MLSRIHPKPRQILASCGKPYRTLGGNKRNRAYFHARVSDLPKKAGTKVGAVWDGYEIALHRTSVRTICFPRPPSSYWLNACCSAKRALTAAIHGSVIYNMALRVDGVKTDAGSRLGVPRASVRFATLWPARIVFGRMLGSFPPAVSQAALKFSYRSDSVTWY